MGEASKTVMYRSKPGTMNRALPVVNNSLMIDSVLYVIKQLKIL